MNVTTYFRFSTIEQASGTSIGRQREDCLRHAERMGWDIVEELIDEGKSAFSGRNREVGSALGGFEEEVRLGLKHGTTLLVERLDRISREGYDQTSDFIKLCMRNGVSVATVDGAEFYEAGSRLETIDVIKILLKAELANEESVKKSQRGKRRYEIDRAAARVSGLVITMNIPAWLEKGPDGRAVIRDGRDAVIRRIFQLASDGVGSLRIVQTINREFEPWTGLGRSAKPSKWTRSRISRILQDRQVCGEFQPCNKVNGKRVPAGDPWIDYFPRIIAQHIFDAVQDASAARQCPAGKRSVVIANLFAGKLKCAVCGSWMLFEGKRAAGSPYQNGKYILKHDEATVRCSSERYGKGCSNASTVSYYGFERAMLDQCLHLALDDRSFADREHLGRVMSKLAEARRTHDVAVSSAMALWNAYAKSPSDMLEASARKSESEAKVLAGTIVTLEAEAATASGQADAEAHRSRINEYRHNLYAEDLDVRAFHRSKVAVAMRAIVEGVTFDADRKARVTLVGNTQVFSILKGKASWAYNLHKLSEDSTPAERAVERRLREAA